jgi:hypothetical protein
LPLFHSTHEDDEQLSTILNTRLIRFLLSFLVTNNVDTINDDSYLSLISQTIQLLVTCKTGSEATRKHLLHQCFESAWLFYAKNKDFNEYLTKVCDENALKELLSA